MKNSKELEKGIAIFEGFLMIIGVLAFSYSIGKEIKLVGATDVNADAPCAGKEGGDLCICKGGVISPVESSCKDNKDLVEIPPFHLAGEKLAYLFKCCKTAYCVKNSDGKTCCTYKDGKTCCPDKNGKTCCTNSAGKCLSPCKLEKGDCVYKASSSTGTSSSTGNSEGSNVDTNTPSTNPIPTSSPYESSNSDALKECQASNGKWCMSGMKCNGESLLSHGGKICCIGTCVIPSQETTEESGTTEESSGTTSDTNKEVTGANLGKSTVGSTILSIIEAGAVALGLSEGVKYLVSTVFPSTSTENVEGIGSAVGWGYFIGQATAGILQACGLDLGVFGASFGIPGIATVGVAGLVIAGVAVLVYLLFGYKESKIFQVTFMCYPWQPSKGGEDCEKCNEPLFGTNEIRCSKYRCESLGASCELINEGTEDELCYYVNRNDVNPPEINAWNGVLKEGFSYSPLTATLPGDTGVNINYIGGGCVPAFTSLRFGVSLDKPGDCKIDTNRSRSYDEMSVLLSDGRALYNHTIEISHSAISGTEEGSVEFPNGGEYEIYVRCQSKNGYSNDVPFVFQYCVDDEPDLTPASIKLTDPLNNYPIQKGKSNITINVYTDKPAECRWSHSNEDYEAMEGKMESRSQTVINANRLYLHVTTLTGLKDLTENVFYFNCKSYPEKEGTNYSSERKTMTTNYVYKLIGTQELVIDSITPNNTLIKDASDSIKVTFNVKTSSGYSKGRSYCSFKEFSKPETDYVLFANTDSYLHSQDLWFSGGTYNYNIRCCDLGGNCDNETISFTVESDIYPPQAIRIYKDGTTLKLITNEEAECVYDTLSCNYEFDNGIAMSNKNNLEHTTTWNTENIFYIKCQDKFGGQPAADECTAILKPSDIF